MKKTLSLILTMVLIVGLISGCTSQDTDSSGQSSSPGENHYPLTIENNGVSITYESAPERIVALSYTTAEVLAALGLTDKVVSLAPSMNRIDEVIEEYRDEISAIPVFDESGMTNGVPSLEVVLSAEPDFVFGSVYSFATNSCGTAEDYIANNIGIYAENTGFGESPSLEDLYTEIKNIGKIFNVEERAEAVVKKLKARESAVLEKLDGVEKVSVYIFDYDLGQGNYYTTGGSNLLDYVISLAGGKGIFDDSGKAYVQVSAEEIIARNPEYVLAVSYYTEDDGQSKIDSMKASPDFADVEAVKANNFLSMSGLAVGASAGIQSLDSLETIAAFLHPDRF